MNCDFQSAVSVDSYDYPPPSQWQLALCDLMKKYGHKGGNISLDVGCGPGRFTEMLRAPLFERAFGVDSSVNMLNRAAARSKQENVSFVAGTAEMLPFPSGAFDFVLLRYLLHHLADIPRVLLEVKRVLSRSSYCVIETANPEVLAQRPVYQQFPDIAMKDLMRWPRISRIVEICSDVGLEVLGINTFKDMRGTQSKDEYRDWLIKWEKNGGGTSFWRLFDSDERSRYAKYELGRLDQTGESYKREIFTESEFLVIRPNGTQK